MAGGWTRLSLHGLVPAPEGSAVKLFDRVFSEEVIRSAPPVLVDVGANGGILPTWKNIARHSIGLGFEPDRREADSLAPAQREFLRWIFSGQIVVSDLHAHQTQLYLTRVPVCSSTLPPKAEELANWSFGDSFHVVGTTTSPASSLTSVLAEHGLNHLDWLKCDTQGTDLRIFQSLPSGRRHQLLVVEFEPGIMDAYEGEDKFHTLLKVMEGEPFWLVKLEVQGVPRGNPAMLRQKLGPRWAKLYARLGKRSPGWANVVYLRRFSRGDDLSRREYLLGWAFAQLLKQPAYALEIAEIGHDKFSDALFVDLAAASVRAMRQTIWTRWSEWPGIAWRLLVDR
jgi:hypothetical protein